MREYESHALYALLDEGTGTVFYIGVSAIPYERFTGHHYDPASGAYHRCRAAKTRMVILGWYRDRNYARWIEGRLVVAHPGLLNRATNEYLDLRYRQFRSESSS